MVWKDSARTGYKHRLCGKLTKCTVTNFKGKNTRTQERSHTCHITNKNAALLIVKDDGTYGYHPALKG